MKPLLIVLTGPTAVGKTSLSIRLAKAIDGEIISGDSMQVYKGMDIGTAKIKKDEMEGIPHHLIDFMEPDCDYDAFTFKQMAKEVLFNIYDRGKLPIICGGTGFYIQSLCYDIDFSKDTDFSYRKMLENMGEDELYEMLNSVDEKYAKITPKENKKRVIRALEFYKTNGYPLSEHNKKEMEKTSPYNLKYFVLTKDRDKLYADIDKRVDMMMSMGLLDEAKRIYDLNIFDNTAAKAIGYHELFSYFRGECSLEDAVNKIKTDTRHFAKRQLTWFRREKDVILVDKDKFPSEDSILEFLLEKINEQ